MSKARSLITLPETKGAVPMEILTRALAIIGPIMFLVGCIWFLILGFKKSIWWGLACLFVPGGGLAFLLIHWDVAEKPFRYSLERFKIEML